MEQERTRVAQDLHDELGAGLTEMSLLVDHWPAGLMFRQKKGNITWIELTKSARSLVTRLG